MASADDRRLGAVLVAVHAIPAAAAVLLASFAIGWLAGEPLTIHRGPADRQTGHYVDDSGERHEVIFADVPSTRGETFTARRMVPDLHLGPERLVLTGWEAGFSASIAALLLAVLGLELRTWRRRSAVGDDDGDVPDIPVADQPTEPRRRADDEPCEDGGNGSADGDPPGS